MNSFYIILIINFGILSISCTSTVTNQTSPQIDTTNITSNVSVTAPVNPPYYFQVKVDTYDKNVEPKVHDFFQCRVDSVLPTDPTDELIRVIKTDPRVRRQLILAPPEGCLNFQVKSSNDAAVTFDTDPSALFPSYKLLLGTSANTKSGIYSYNEAASTTIHTPGILSSYSFREFWIEWSNSTIIFGYGGKPNYVLVLIDANQRKINYIGFESSNNVIANWNIKVPKTKSECISRPSQSTVPQKKTVLATCV